MNPWETRSKIEDIVDQYVMGQRNDARAKMARLTNVEIVRLTIEMQQVGFSDLEIIRIITFALEND